MNSVAAGLVLIPGAVALLVLLVFTYLYEQNRHSYFRAWQLAWAAYTLHYALKAVEYFQGPSAFLFFLSSVLLAGMAICIFVSTRLMKEPFQLKWYDVALMVTGVLLAYATLRAHIVAGVFRESATPGPIYLRLEMGLAAILLYCSFHFYRYAARRNSVAFRALFFSLALWAALMGVGQLRQPFLDVGGPLGGFLGPIPQMLLAIAMVMVLFENERNAVQDNALEFSTLGVDPRRLLSASDLVPRLQTFVERLVAPLPWRRALRAKGLFTGIPGKTAKDPVWRLHRRTSIPAQRSGHLPESTGTRRAFTGAFGRKVRGLQADAARGGNHRPDGGEPADAGAQFRGHPFSARGTADVRLLELAAADRAGAADRADAGK